MQERDLREYFRIADELTRLSRVIQANKAGILQNYPQVLSIIPVVENDRDCVIAVSVSEESGDLRESLQRHFKNERVTLQKPDLEPAKWPLIRLLFEKDISDVLDDAGNREGFFMAVELDEKGPFLDVRLNHDNEATRAALQEAYPGVRIEFGKNGRPLTLEIR